MRIAADITGKPQMAYAQTLSGTQNPQNARGTERTRAPGGAFDQVDISRGTTKESTFHKEMAARMVQDVRTSTSIGDIQQLRERVRTGEYRVNPEKIASAMLLGG